MERGLGTPGHAQCDAHTHRYRWGNSLALQRTKEKAHTKKKHLLAVFCGDDILLKLIVCVIRCVPLRDGPFKKSPYRTGTIIPTYAQNDGALLFHRLCKFVMVIGVRVRTMNVCAWRVKKTREMATHGSHEGEVRQT